MPFEEWSSAPAQCHHSRFPTESMPTSSSIHLAFASPRKLPKARDLLGRVVVLDIAFASEAGGHSFESTTLPFIQALGPRLAAWVDHHDSQAHQRFAMDPRFLLSTKAEHGACPEDDHRGRRNEGWPR